MKKETTREKATILVRMFPSTYQRLRRKAFDQELSYPQVLDALL